MVIGTSYVTTYSEQWTIEILSVHSVMATPVSHDSTFLSRLAAVKTLLAPELAAAEAAGASPTAPFLTDRTLTRFTLGHASCDPSGVAEIVRKTLAWRASVGADSVRARLAALPRATISARDLPNYELVCANMVFGTTSLRLVARDGRPVVLRLLGMVNPAVALELVAEELFDEFWLGYMEMVHIGLDRLSDEQKILVRYHVIIDLSGLGRQHCSAAAVQCFKRLSAVAQFHYPENVYKFHIINAPWIFESVFSLIKRFIAPATQRKIVVVGAVGSEECVAAMATIMPLAELPVLLGGERPNGEILVLRRDVDPSACSTTGSSDWTQTIHVATGKVEHVPVPLAPGTTRVAWQWTAAEYDLDFSATLVPTPRLSSRAGTSTAESSALVSGSERVTDDLSECSSSAVVVERIVMPKERLMEHSGECVLSAEEVAASAEQSWTLHFVFDNYFSWMTPKVLTLRTWMPEEA